MSSITDEISSSSEQHFVPLNDDKGKDILTDTGKKLIREVCSKMFSKDSNLRHLSTQTGKKPFACEICSKGFDEKQYLRNHLLIHTGEKPFICEVCSKAFLRKNDLRNHLSTHTGEKRFVCGVCSKEFSFDSNLRRHLLTHTGEKSFVCEKCFKGFSDNSNLRQHLLTHTGENLFFVKYVPEHFLVNVILENILCLILNRHAS